MTPIALPDFGRGRPLLGVSLQPDRAFLQQNRALIEDEAELFEVTPETTWRAGAQPGGGHKGLLDLVRRLQRPAVGHGVLFGLGNAEPPTRRQQWLRGLQRDQAAFGFRWLSEHLGFADAGGRHATLPLPLPPTDETATLAASNLRQLKAVTPLVAFENNADYFALGDPLAQPVWFGSICERADAWLVLDLHNAYTQCLATGCDLDAWLDRLPWPRVLEIHLSGGSESEAEWLPSARVMRLDSHDGPVPEPVWAAFAAARKRATNLRAVVLEWLPDGMTAEAAGRFAADFARARRLLC